MRIVILLLVLSFGVMIYRGDLDKISEGLGIPSASQAVPQIDQINKSSNLVPAPVVDIKQAVKENGKEGTGLSYLIVFLVYFIVGGRVRRGNSESTITG